MLTLHLSTKVSRRKLRCYIGIFMDHSTHSIHNSYGTRVTGSHSNTYGHGYFIFTTKQNGTYRRHINTNDNIIIMIMVDRVGRPIISRSINDPTIRRLASGKVRLRLGYQRGRTISVYMRLDDIISSTILHGTRRVIRYGLAMIDHDHFRYGQTRIVISKVNIHVVLNSTTTICDSLSVTTIPVFLRLATCRVTLMNFPNGKISIFIGHAIRLGLQASTMVVSSVLSTRQGHPYVSHVFLLTNLKRVIIVWGTLERVRTIYRVNCRLTTNTKLPFTMIVTNIGVKTINGTYTQTSDAKLGLSMFVKLCTSTLTNINNFWVTKVIIKIVLLTTRWSPLLLQIRRTIKGARVTMDTVLVMLVRPTT